MEIELDGRNLSMEELLLVATGVADAIISETAKAGIEAATKTVQGIIERGEVAYGINTGFGALCNTSIDASKLGDLQANLIRSHACGIGEAMEVVPVRAMMCARANSLCRGNSGIRIEVIQRILDMLNLGLTPVVPRIGSLGASGDLAPLSHVALTIMGEGSVIDQYGEFYDTSEALLNNDLKPIQLQAKEGLSLINGTSQILSWLTISHAILSDLLPLADLILSTSIEALSGSIAPSDERIHAVRPHPGQALVANRILRALKNSEINQSHADCDKVQDPYSFRCAPQVHGPANEVLQRLGDVITIELNSATDNPLIFPDPANPGPHEVVSGGNFHGEILALTADAMNAAVHEIASISERRMDTLLDTNRSGLPAFLANDSGLESGMMIVQYAAVAAIADLRAHLGPHTTFSLSTSANQEDHVSMGATAAWHLFQGAQRLADILSCEAIIACEGLEHHEKSPGDGVDAFYKHVRTLVEPLQGDRSLAGEMADLANDFLNGIGDGDIHPYLE
jgi:histidine ammonia-lyase